MARTMASKMRKAQEKKNLLSKDGRWKFVCDVTDIEEFTQYLSEVADGNQEAFDLIFQGLIEANSSAHGGYDFATIQVNGISDKGCDKTFLYKGNDADKQQVAVKTAAIDDDIRMHLTIETNGKNTGYRFSTFIKTIRGNFHHIFAEDWQIASHPYKDCLWLCRANY